jgi:phosphoenolpyruvate-protein phosphotransferase (PTS system enzyme I)
MSADPVPGPLPGRAASPGAALGPAFVIAPRLEVMEEKTTDDPEQERERVDAALSRTASDLEQLADELGEDAGEEQAEIFLAHAEFATDPELADRVHASIAAGASAERAVREGFGTFRSLLEQSSSEYLAARATDLDDVRDQVLDVLAGREVADAPTEPCVVVAVELTPSQTARIPREYLLAIACERGSPTSHSAILARSLRIPAVVGVDGLLGHLEAGQIIAVDGESGEVIIEPDAKTQTEIQERGEAYTERAEELRLAASQPCVTADGRRIEVAANIDGPDALGRAIDHGAEGTGLVRTELLFLESTEPPSIEDQTEYYQRVLATFPGERVVVRTMDIGADKPLPFVDREEEDNPALGLRGLRLGLARPDLLRDQLRALLRAAITAEDDSGQLAIMFPLVSRVDEVPRALALLEEAARAEDMDPGDLSGIEIGVMIEVPSAALAARRIAAQLDFVSIGTNDLLQYLFAVDRVNADVAAIPDLLDPDILRLLRDVADAAHDEGAWIGVCGEAAADPLTAAALVGAGADELSATPAAIPEVKAMLRAANAQALADAVTEAIGLPDADAVRERLRRETLA